MQKICHFDHRLHDPLKMWHYNESTFYTVNKLINTACCNLPFLLSISLSMFTCPFSYSFVIFSLFHVCSSVNHRATKMNETENDKTIAKRKGKQRNINWKKKRGITACCVHQFVNSVESRLIIMPHFQWIVLLSDTVVSFQYVTYLIWSVCNWLAILRFSMVDIECLSERWLCGAIFFEKKCLILRGLLLECTLFAIIRKMYAQWGQGYPGVDPAQQMYWQQYYAAAGFSQPQQFYGAYGSVVPAAGNTTTTASTPVPPAEPPKEERPPLPAEPPPDEVLWVVTLTGQFADRKKLAVSQLTDYSTRRLRFLTRKGEDYTIFVHWA